VLHALYEYVEILDIMNMCLMGCELCKDKFIMLFMYVDAISCKALEHNGNILIQKKSLSISRACIIQKRKKTKKSSKLNNKKEIHVCLM
jgi:hypothetical protein